MGLININPRLVLIGAGVAAVVLGALYFAGRRALPAIGEAINPLNRENIFISGADRVTEAVTGDPSLGGWLAEIFNADVRAANAAMRAPVVLADRSAAPELASDFFLGAP